jgi:hypothetical protein
LLIGPARRRQIAVGESWSGEQQTNRHPRESGDPAKQESRFPLARG